MQKRYKDKCFYGAITSMRRSPLLRELKEECVKAEGLSVDLLTAWHNRSPAKLSTSGVRFLATTTLCGKVFSANTAMRFGLKKPLEMNYLAS